MLSAENPTFARPADTSTHQGQLRCRVVLNNRGQQRLHGRSLLGRLTITRTLLWVCEVDQLLDEARGYASGTVRDMFTAEENAPSFTAREEMERLGVWTRAFISTIHFSKELRGEQLGCLAARAAAA